MYLWQSTWHAICAFYSTKIPWGLQETGAIRPELKLKFFEFGDTGWNSSLTLVSRVSFHLTMANIVSICETWALLSYCTDNSVNNLHEQNPAQSILIIIIPCQGFIQALEVRSVFLDRLSFYMKNPPGRKNFGGPPSILGLCPRLTAMRSKILMKYCPKVGHSELY